MKLFAALLALFRPRRNRSAEAFAKGVRVVNWSGNFPSSLHPW
jgi:hypothetical protein